MKSVRQTYKRVHVLNKKPHDEKMWDRRGATPLILNLGTDGGEWSLSVLDHFTALTCQ